MSIRGVIGNCVGFILVLCWRLLSFGRRSDNILSIYFHNPNKDVFLNCVSFLQRRGYTFISEDQLIEKFNNKDESNKKNVFISLDDAWSNNLLNVFPIILDKKIPVTLFTPIEPLKDGVLWLKYFRKADEKILTKYLIGSNLDIKKIPNNERVIILKELKKQYSFEREIMSIDDLLKLKQHNRYVKIGGHTYSHPILTQCDSNTIKSELHEAKKVLENLTKEEVNSIAYPNGDYNNDVLKCVKYSGYKLAFTTEQRMLNITSDKLFKLPRFCIPDNYGKYESIARMLGIWSKIF